jgi:hypothetical protein
MHRSRWREDNEIGIQEINYEDVAGLNWFIIWYKVGCL